MTTCMQCPTEVHLLSFAGDSVEVYVGDTYGDEAPLRFCSVACAGTFLTDLAQA